MSAPSTVAAQPTKRPLEDPSPSQPSDQPDAKRPALDKVVKSSDEQGQKKPVVHDEQGQRTPITESIEKPLVVSSNGAIKNDGEHTNGTKDAEGDTVVGDASVREGTQPIETTAVARRSERATPVTQNDESEWIHIRAVIASSEAATIIGKGGENVTLIRTMSGAKCTVSEYQKGAVERILTVSGQVDSVAKAFGLIIRTLNMESLDEPCTPQSKTYPLRLLIPHILVGSIIGKGGARIREIQEHSGARLNASDACLPLSSERSLVVLGVADAIHIATYYVGSTLFEQLKERFGGPGASAYASRNGGPAGAVPGGMQVVPYIPIAGGGTYGHPDNMRRHDRPMHTPAHGAYHQGYAQHVAQVPVHFGGSPAAAYGGLGPQMPGQPGPAGPQAHPNPAQPMAGMVPGQPLTQQIFIPNDMVGAIIGKGGQKINEIRQLSGSVIKINEPQDNSNERLVTITGTQECNQMALYMLYSRLESEKHRI